MYACCLPNSTRKTLGATGSKPRSLITEIQLLCKNCRNISIMFRQHLCCCSKIWVRTFLVGQTSILHDTFNGYKLHFHSSDATWEEHQGPPVVWSNAAEWRDLWDSFNIFTLAINPFAKDFGPQIRGQFQTEKWPDFEHQSIFTKQCYFAKIVKLEDLEGFRGHKTVCVCVHMAWPIMNHDFWKLEFHWRKEWNDIKPQTRTTICPNTHSVDCMSRPWHIHGVGQCQAS